jgi:hypothetical protein
MSGIATVGVCWAVTQIPRGNIIKSLPEPGAGTSGLAREDGLRWR